MAAGVRETRLNGLLAYRPGSPSIWEDAPYAHSPRMAAAIIPSRLQSVLRAESGARARSLPSPRVKLTCVLIAAGGKLANELQIAAGATVERRSQGIGSSDNCQEPDACFRVRARPHRWCSHPFRCQMANLRWARIRISCLNFCRRMTRSHRRSVTPRLRCAVGDLLSGEAARLSCGASVARVHSHEQPQMGAASAAERVCKSQEW
jgi:hypothetical protein